MSRDRRAEFLEWCKNNKNDPFDIQKEMKKYCISDVDILCNACCKFRQGLREEMGVIETIKNPYDWILNKSFQQGFGKLREKVTYCAIYWF